MTGTGLNDQQANNNPTIMDSLDRMYRHLVRTIRARFPHYLMQPFSVEELHQTVLPYRLHRRELGIETNEDYEIVLTELLAGQRDYLIVDDRMRDVLRKELASSNPDPTAFKQFATATVALSPGALRSLEIGATEEPIAVRATAPAGLRPSAPHPTTNAPSIPPSAPTTRPSAQVMAVPATPPSGAAAQRISTGAKMVTPTFGERCRSCNEALPAGRPVTFCPHCGQNVTTMHCPACGSELEVGWKFCPTCGRPA